MLSSLLPSRSSDTQLSCGWTDSQLVSTEWREDPMNSLSYFVCLSVKEYYKEIKEPEIDKRGWIPVRNNAIFETFRADIISLTLLWLYKSWRTRKWIKLQKAYLLLSSWLDSSSAQTTHAERDVTNHLGKDTRIPLISLQKLSRGTNHNIQFNLYSAYFNEIWNLRSISKGVVCI